MKSYTINVYPRETIYQEYKFSATFDDYDGAPIDYDRPSRCPIGYGDTEYDAMYDLIEKCL